MRNDMEWISVNDRLPEYKIKVLVVRPNIGRHNQIWIDTAYLHEKKLEGQSYGRRDEWNKITYNDYWSFPAIVPMSEVTHWMPLPEPPK